MENMEDETLADGFALTHGRYPADIKQALRSAELKDFKETPAPKVYEYDIPTQAGRTYTFTSK